MALFESDAPERVGGLQVIESEGKLKLSKADKLRQKLKACEEKLREKTDACLQEGRCFELL